MIKFDYYSTEKNKKKKNHSTLIISSTPRPDHTEDIIYCDL